MKKIIIATLIICVVFCMLLSHKEYRNYKITNITLSEIVDCYQRFSFEFEKGK